MLLLIILLILLFGAGGYAGYGRYSGTPALGGNTLWLIIIVLIVLALFGSNYHTLGL